MAELQRTRRSDPDVYQTQLIANAAARRLKRRLQNAGLPSKQLHAVAAAERRANEREAELYFGGPRLSAHVRQSDVFTETLTKHMLESGPQMRAFAESHAATRARMGLPPVAVEDMTYARAVEFVLERLDGMELLTSRDIAAAVRSSRAVVQQHEREQQFERLMRTVVAHVNRHRTHLIDEAELENRARLHRGLPRLETDALVVQLALRDVEERLQTNRLTIADVRSVTRTAKLRVFAVMEGPPRSETQVVARPPR